MSSGDTDRYKVMLELDGEQLEQLIRLLDMAKMMNGREFDSGKKPERFDVFAYRAAIEKILIILRDALDREALLSQKNA